VAAKLKIKTDAEEAGQDQGRHRRGGGQATGGGNRQAEGDPIEFMVDEHFAGLHRMVTGTPAPLGETMKLFNGSS
jgi:type VI secretion system protein ImpL